MPKEAQEQGLVGRGQLQEELELQQMSIAGQTLG